VALTLHRAQGEQLKCHYCDRAAPPPTSCPRCGAHQLSEEGAGTERIQTILAEAFPTARIARLDRDVAAGAKSERVLSKMRRREIDILVGTQMVTKGHDLPDVTLVGVLNADAALALPDFRAAERCFQLLVQVAGRAGRSERRGTVIVQTRKPDHPAVRHAVRHDVGAFIESEMRERKELGYPPFSRIALVRVDAVAPGDARREAERLAEIARASTSAALQVLGPAAAPLARLRNRYRYRFMLRARERAPLRAALLAVLRSKVPHKVRMSVDVDPVNML
jgi:primosomal protein N' (replication factor Y)